MRIVNLRQFRFELFLKKASEHIGYKRPEAQRRIISRREETERHIFIGLLKLKLN